MLRLLPLLSNLRISREGLLKTEMSMMGTELEEVFKDRTEEKIVKDEKEIEDMTGKIRGLKERETTDHTIAERETKTPKCMEEEEGKMDDATIEESMVEERFLLQMGDELEIPRPIPQRSLDLTSKKKIEIRAETREGVEATEFFSYCHTLCDIFPHIMRYLDFFVKRTVVIIVKFSHCK